MMTQVSVPQFFELFYCYNVDKQVQITCLNISDTTSNVDKVEIILSEVSPYIGHSSMLILYQ